MQLKKLTPTNWFKRNIPMRREIGSSLDRFNQDINRLFDDFAQDFGDPESLLPRVFRSNLGSNIVISPRIDISETDKEYIVEADLPGVKEADLDMSITKDGMLTIKGKRETKQEEKDRDYYRIERSYGSFERSIALPENGDFDNPKADFHDNVLTIKIVKKEPTNGEVKKIQLNK